MYPEVELPGHLVTVLNLPWKLRLFSTAATPFYIPISHAQESQFLYILASTCYFAFLFYYNHQRRGEWDLMVAQICILSSICSCPCWPSTYLLWGSICESALPLQKDASSIPVWGTKTPHTTRHGEKKTLFRPQCAAGNIFVPCLGIEPMPLTLGVQSSNHWTTREAPISAFLNWVVCLSPVSTHLSVTLYVGVWGMWGPTTP